MEEEEEEVSRQVLNLSLWKTLIQNFRALLFFSCLNATAFTMEHKQTWYIQTFLGRSTKVRTEDIFLSRKLLRFDFSFLNSHYFICQGRINVNLYSFLKNNKICLQNRNDDYHGHYWWKIITWRILDLYQTNWSLKIPSPQYAIFHEDICFPSAVQQTNEFSGDSTP